MCHIFSETLLKEIITTALGKKTDSGNVSVLGYIEMHRQNDCMDVLNGQQIGRVWEACIAKAMSSVQTIDERCLTYYHGKEGAHDKDIMCNEDADMCIELKCSQTSGFQGGVHNASKKKSEKDNAGLYMFLKYTKDDDWNIKVKYLYFGYITPDIWKLQGNGSHVNVGTLDKLGLMKVNF